MAAKSITRKPQSDHQKEVRAGAAAFESLLDRIVQIDDDAWRAVPNDDRNAEPDIDYVLMVEEIDRSIRANAIDAPAAHRQGFLRAMAHCLLSHLAGASGDPIKETARAFGRSASNERNGATLQNV